MTMSTAPGVKLDPSVLASTVPLKRTGTEEVSEASSDGWLAADWPFGLVLLGYGWHDTFPSKPSWSLCQWSCVACGRWPSKQPWKLLLTYFYGYWWRDLDLCRF